MAYVIQTASTRRPLLFLMVDDSDHLTGKTGLSPTVTISKNGAAFASPAGAVTEIGNGWYQVAANATDNETLGMLLLHAEATDADDADSYYEVVAFNPDSATNLGLSALTGTVTASVPVSLDSSTLTLVRGDDYNSTVGDEIQFSSDDWVDLTGATITLSVRRKQNQQLQLEVTGTVSEADGTQTISFTPTSDETAVMKPGYKDHLFDVQAVLPTSEYVKTLVRGECTVLEDQTR
jgi:hypothetical protein